jgi:transglutaminase-like putative cysteine protease
LRRPQPGDSALYQQITLEPTNQYWLLALDRPVSRPTGSALSRDGQLLSRQTVRQRIDYRVASDPAAGEQELEAAEWQRALQLPEGQVTPRMQALVDRWVEAGSEAAVVTQALSFYRQQPFVYTLYPPVLPANPVDAFLFDTRRGFCEHYATSFVVLMRAAGIPARVVGGYQGGEWNPRGEHLVVRQSDAHAWAEVWLEGQGWVRVDPTAAVAPERIERPIETAGAEGGPVVFASDRDGLLGRLWQEGVWMVDALELGWQRWVVGYSALTQSDLLKQLGLDFLTGYRLALAAVGAGLLGLLPLLWWLRRQPAVRVDPLQQHYRLLLDRLARAGLSISPSLSPSAVARLAGESYPDQALELQRIVGLYLQLRYGPGRTPRQQRQLRAMVRRLRLVA